MRDGTEIQRHWLDIVNCPREGSIYHVPDLGDVEVSPQRFQAYERHGGNPLIWLMRATGAMRTVPLWSAGRFVGEEQE